MNKPKHEIMSPVDMEAMAVETRATSRLYSKTSDSGKVVQALVSQLAAELAAAPKTKIDLRDEDMIVRVAVAYVDACAKSGVIPSKVGFCRAAGYSRQAVEYYMNHHSEENGAERLRMIFDSFAEMLNAAALANACHPIVSIFLSKALYGYRDAIALETEIKQDPLGERRSAAEISAKYKGFEDWELPD